MKDNKSTTQPTLEIKAYNPIFAAINGLREKYSYIPDCSTDEGLKQVKEDYRTVRKVEINLESKRKDLGETARKKLNSINDEAKIIDSKIKEISAPLKLAFEKREAEIKEKEKQRKDDIQAKINNLRTFENTEGMNSAAISAVIEAVEEIDCSQGFFEFTESALITKKKVQEVLGKALNDALLQEQLAVERKKLKEEAEAQAEQLRINELKAKAQERLNNLIMIPSSMFGKSSLVINQKITLLGSYEVKEDEFGELFNQANVTKEQVIQQLGVMSTQQVLVEKMKKDEQDRLEQSQTPAPTAENALNEAVATEQKPIKQRLAERFEDTRTSVDTEVAPIQHKAVASVKTPTVGDIDNFLGALDVNSLNDFGFLLLSGDSQQEAEALNNIKAAFQQFMQQEAA